MNPQLASELASAVERMPAFPHSVQRVMELAQDDNATARDLVQVIDKDPVLTVKLLKVVNSAYFRLPKPVGTVGQAVVFLGINQTRNLALSMAAIGMLPAQGDEGFRWNEYLVHSLATASIAKQLATSLPKVDPVECFVAGLLHDFGKVVMARSMATQFHRAVTQARRDGSSLHMVLREQVGTDHMTACAMLLERWRMSPTLVEAVRHQFGPVVPDNGTIACVYAANQISKKLALGDGGNAHVSELPDVVVARLGGTLDELIARLDGLEQIESEARLFATL